MGIKRFYQIFSTLLTFGLDTLVPEKWQPWYWQFLRSSAFWLRNKHPDKSQGERLRLALEHLGPVWVKFGQMMSTRGDLFPPEWVEELIKLQDKVPPFSGEEAQAVVLHQLGLHTIEPVFSYFDLTPLASASIAQVHTAGLRLEDGSIADVVVKVIRPGIRPQIIADLELMQALANLVARFLPDGKRLRPQEVIAEYSKNLLDELDLQREAANAIQLRRNFEGSDALYIPHVYEDFSRPSVMVMERIYGIPVSDLTTLRAQNTNLELLAKRGVEVFFTQVFRDSFFHGDMHPGNIFVSRETPENPKYIAIDFGIVGTLNKEDKRYLAENFVAFFNRDYLKVAQLHIDSGWVPADTCVEEFESAIRTVCEPIFQKPLKDISFGIVLFNLFNTARRFHMQVQPQLVLLQKTLLYIEGLGRQLYPQLDLWQTAKPFLEDWVRKQMGPAKVWEELKANLPYWAEKLPEMPTLLHQYLQQGPRNQKLLLEQLLLVQLQQQNQTKKLTYAVFGGMSLVGTVLLLTSGWTITAACCGILTAVMLWKIR